MFFNEIHKAILDCMSEAVYVIDREMNILYSNPASERLTGYSADESVGKKCEDIFCEKSELCAGKCPPKRSMEEHTPILHRDAETRTKHGEIKKTQISFSPFYENGACVGEVIVIKDITEIKKAEERIRRQNSFFKTVMDALPHPFIVMDAKSYKVSFANRAACGRKPGENTTCFSLSHQSSFPCSTEDHPCPLDGVRKTGESVTVEHVHTNDRGNNKYVEVHCFPIFDDSGNVVQVGEYEIDITTRKRMEEELRVLSVRDELTGLHNRRGFMTLAEQHIRMADRKKEKLFILYADMDGLKAINDTLGHQAGDEALREIAALLKESFRESDIIARIGGDEFVIMPIGSTESKASIALDRLYKNIGDFNAGEKGDYTLSLSVGISYYDPENPITVPELLVKGDCAMYENKRCKKQ